MVRFVESRFDLGRFVGVVVIGFSVGDMDERFPGCCGTTLSIREINGCFEGYL